MVNVVPNYQHVAKKYSTMVWDNVTLKLELYGHAGVTVDISSQTHTVGTTADKIAREGLGKLSPILLFLNNYPGPHTILLLE